MGVKVISPPSQVITSAELRQHCRLAASGSQDELLTTYLEASRREAQRYTRLAIGEQLLELALDQFPGGYGPEQAIKLEGGNVSSIVSVKYTDTQGVEQTLDPSLYSLDTYTDDGDKCYLLPAVNTIWPFTQVDAANAVRVRYVAGELTDDMKAALLLMVSFKYENRGGSVEGEADLQPPAARALLRMFKDWS
jgi:uncharacterized phiE125 gp8 family phage protein